MSDNERESRQLPPVAWLLGRQLIASLKWILLYTAFGSKLDARDWMDAKVYPAKDADEKWKELHEAHVGQKSSQSGTDYWENKEFWFDYLSDTGDGTRATYSIAYLCMSNLWVRQRWETGMPDPHLADVQLDQFADAEHPELLPRGEFLLIGGDTSYHLSDYATLHLRFQNPFDWAYEDLINDLTAADRKKDSNAPTRKIDRRPLFAIPGNHDYYDMLDGFRRQFRTPTSSRPDNKDYAPGDLSAPQLRLRGFIKQQDTSYIALQLPNAWMLWGLDTELGKIDERQRDFFLGLKEETPDKLIVATSAPTTAFGKGANREDEKCSKAFLQLKLARPFVTDLPPGETTLRPDQIRLDIAGDIHQYARYWGPTSNPSNPRPTAKRTAPTADNYASVVSGLGGAFHHPSTTYVDEVKEQALYPTELVSRREVANQIFNPLKVFRGGGVGVIGAVIAAILTFSAIANQSSRPAIHNFLPFVVLNLTTPEAYLSAAQMTAEKTQEENAAAVPQNPNPSQLPTVQPQSVKPFFLWREIIPIAGDTWTPIPKDPAKCGQNKMIFLWGDCSVNWPWDYVVGLILLLSTLVVIYFTYSKTEKIYADTDTVAKPDLSSKVPMNAFARFIGADRVTWRVLKILVPTFALNLALITVGVLSIVPYLSFITPFGNSLWVFLTLIWAGSSIFFSLRYSDWLFLQASKTTVSHRDWLITWALSAAVIAGLAVGLWLFGKNNLPAYLLADVVFVTVVLATLGGLIYVAISMGGQHQKRAGKVAMFFVGLWHWLLQLGVALMLIKKGTWLTVLLAIFVFFIFYFIGKSFLAANYKKRLVAAWVAYGAVMLGLPPFVYWVLTKFPPAWWWLRDAFFWPHQGPGPSFAAYEWWIRFEGFWQLFPLALAAIFGLIFSCIWVGWYFGVCLRFNGHNNETGGAARIEKFKQFIRFRLTADDLVGYVIAVDQPKAKGSEVQGDVRIVDVFRLTRATKPVTQASGSNP